MNRSVRKASGFVWTLLLTFCLAASLCGDTRAQFEKTYDWTVEINTEPVQGRLQYPGTSFKEISRLRVSYYKGTNKDESEATHYEDLWYSGPNIIGERRDHSFGLTPGEHLVIRVKHKKGTPTQGEAQAAADAIVRLVVDAYANRNMTAAIMVPADSFQNIVEGMGRLQFYPAQPPKPDQPVYTLMILHLYSEPGGQHQIMHYNKET